MVGYFLVALQFSLISIICILGLSDNIMSNYRLFLAFGGIFIGLYAVYSMKFSMSVLPKPKHGQDLVTSGIYKYIRHPAYLAVLLFCLAFVNSVLSVGLYLMLIGVLTIKMSIEEKMLTQKFDKYSSYKERTKRLIPFIF
jgi:protein-S-isoprenylcysteine O-methyltransferase Ste14